MHKIFKEIHENAVRCARGYIRSEHEMILSIQQVDAKKVFRKFGRSSLFEYCTSVLKLGEARSLSLIRVARKGVDVPELIEAIGQGELSVSNATKMASVINRENADEWIERGKTMKTRELEKEVAKANPKEAVRERTKPVAENRVELRVGISGELEGKLRAIQDELSQKRKKAVSLEEVLEVLVEGFGSEEKEVEVFTRIVKPGVEKGKRTSVPRAMVRAVWAKYDRQCGVMDSQGRRCTSRRWLDVHHVRPISRGGNHSMDNLVLVCSAHHRLIHENAGHGVNTVRLDDSR